jgi:hypothetical protein
LATEHTTGTNLDYPMSPDAASSDLNDDSSDLRSTTSISERTSEAESPSIAGKPDKVEKPSIAAKPGNAMSLRLIRWLNWSQKDYAEIRVSVFNPVVLPPDSSPEEHQTNLHQLARQYLDIEEPLRGQDDQKVMDVVTLVIFPFTFTRRIH